MLCRRLLRDTRGDRVAELGPPPEEIQHQDVQGSMQRELKFLHHQVRTDHQRVLQDQEPSQTQMLLLGAKMRAGQLFTPQDNVQAARGCPGR